MPTTRPAYRLGFVASIVYLFGGYFAKLPAARALELAGIGKPMSPFGRLVYLGECCCFGGGYLARVATSRAIEQALR